MNKDQIKSENSTKTWPDLSAYDIHFGIVVMPTGEKKLVMIDSSESWTAFARKMGFKRSRWAGLWVQDSLSFTIPGFKKLFPKGAVTKKTEGQIIEETKSKVLEKQDRRFSALNASSVSRLSWHPNKIKSTAAAIQGAYKKDESTLLSTPSVVINQTIYLGKNYLGEDVYENGDGTRHTSLNGQILAKEVGEGSAAFLRATTSDELIKCAQGMVKQIASGRNLHSEDFERYVSAIFGGAEVENVTKFHDAVDKALQEELQQSHGLAKDIFTRATRLHDGRPSYWRPEGSHPTPLPLSVLMQSVALNKIGDGFSTVIDITSKPDQHSWMIERAINVHGENYPVHDVSIGGIFKEESAEESIMNVRVSRKDHKALLSSLEKRSPEGVSILVVASDEKPGKLDSDFKRVISRVGSEYEVLGMIDVDPKMLGCGNTVGSRILVIGNKKSEIDHNWAVPTYIEVAYDYETLWNWSEVVKTLENDLDVSFGSDDRESNQWQSPYIPSSQISEPKGMSPRNMLAPVRKALAQIIDQTGMSIDDYVASKLQMDLKEIEEKELLDSEQMDAIALGIFAIDNKKHGDQAFIVGDQTGFGKGRILASISRYLILSGKNIVFFTEKSSLFRDIYRDIEDLGSLDVFKDPIIKNANIDLISPKNVPIGKSKSKEEIFDIFSEDGISGGKVMLSTYSQISKDILKIKTSIDSFKNALFLYRTDASHLPGLIAVIKEYKPSKGFLNIVDKEDFDISNLNEADRKKFEKILEREISAVKSKESGNSVLQWIKNGNHSETVFVLDEAHNAAGEKSNINFNISGAIDHSYGVLYSSATFAKETSNFSIFRRVFPSFVDRQKISDILNAGGVPLQEILSVMLAEDGKMIRREHDLSNLEFRLTIDTDRKERNEYWSDAMSDVICGIANLNKKVYEHVQKLNAKNNLGKKGKDKSNDIISSHFASRLYNIMRAFSMSVNADLAVDRAINCLKQGIKPVIGVENTMESVIAEIVNEILIERGFEEEIVEEVDEESDKNNDPVDDEEDDTLSTSARRVVDPLTGLVEDNTHKKDPGQQLVTEQIPVKKKVKWEGQIILDERISFKNILQRYIDRCFVVTVKKGREKIKEKIYVPETEDLVKSINEHLCAMPEIPLSSLDYLTSKINKAGYSITEISGRKIRLIDLEDGRQAIERMPLRVKNEQIDGFNSGEINVAIISKSGATGCSLHASETFADQSQRAFIELQPAQDIRTRLQFWGRVNRKGQVCNPIIEMLSSGLPAEMRLNIMQNSNLRKMSASISGNADNSAINENAPDIINKIGNEVCFRFFENNPEVATQLGVWPLPESFADGKTDTEFVDRLTSRISMLKIEKQKQVYEEIMIEFNSLIQQYEMSGTNPLRSGVYDVRAKKTNSVKLEIGSVNSSSPFADPVRASSISYNIVIPPINKEETEKEWKDSLARIHEKYGNEFEINKINEIEKRYGEISKTILPQSYASVFDAQHDKKPNAVRNLYLKTSTLKEMVKKIQPGAIIALTGLNYVRDRFIILDIEYAENRVCAPSEYVVKMRGVNEPAAQKVSLSSIFSLTTDLISKPGMRNYEEESSKFYSMAKDEYILNQERIILEGNLFKAAELSELIGSGQPISYTNENGLWQHAILMPKGTEMDSLKNGPVSPLSGKEMLQYIKDVSSQIPVRIFSTTKIDRTKAVFEVYFSKGLTMGQIICRSAAEQAEWLLEDSGLKQFMLGDFMNGRGMRVARLDMNQLDAFCDYFNNLSKANNTPPVMVMAREWQQKYYEKIEEEKKQTVVNSDDEDFDEFSPKIKIA